MANGRVVTGFSKPYVALYAVSTAGVVSYSSGQVLARGVNVTVTPDDPGDNNFYADNIVAETASAGSGTGEISLTVDGLKDAANKLIYGLPAATGGWTHYGLDQSIPYVGIGFVIRTQEDQAVKYVPCIIRKAKFDDNTIEAATQEDSIDWQTSELTGKYMRDDSSDASWKWLGSEESTESAAEAKIKTAFSIS